ncbi:MAG: S41 family peptidase [Pirellulaceae bacterium]|nr:S41 family peptidase [Pirellulaceae bacterium]
MRNPYAFMRANVRLIGSLPMAFVVTLAIVLSPTGLTAQVAIPAAALPDEAAFKQALERGHELESQRRWGEALAHYEDALKDHPERHDIQDRLTRARIHYDLGRRYDDDTFTASVGRLSERDALELYTEILRKIESHYFQKPDWQQLAARGVKNVNIALTEASFLRKNGLLASKEAIDTFRDEVRRRMAVTEVRNQQQANEVAINVARLADSKLGLRPSAIILEFASGAACALDQYSCFLTGGQLDDVFSQIEGSFVGLGIELKAVENSLAIISVIPGSPAAVAGLRAGDRIVGVDGVSTTNISTDEAANLLKGQEGSSVEIGIADGQGGLRRVQLVRRRVEVPSIEGARIVDADHGVAYMRLGSFQKTTSRDLDAALWELHRQGMQSLIVDVRGNPGGLLTAAVDASDKFLSSGNIVVTRGRNSHEDFDYRAHSVGTWRVPLIVLIDGDTASASEIFAGAIRDHHRGTVVGQRSYGKGSVQGIFSLVTSKAGVRLTTAKFYSPSGHAISNRGVYPDLAVTTAKKPVDGGQNELPGENDEVLDAAVQFARTRLSGQMQAAAR